MAGLNLGGLREQCTNQIAQSHHGQLVETKGDPEDLGAWPGLRISTSGTDRGVVVSHS